MKPFNASDYGPAIAPLLSPLPLPELGPGSPHQSVREAIGVMTLEDVFPGFSDRDMALACLSGLWLLHDFLEESHHISQDLDTPAGSMWHAIMHRREPDAWNSKYWWRRAGAHPVIDALQSEAREIGYGYKDPEGFVDFCESVRGSGSSDEELARRVQLLEWKILFHWCWHSIR
jgi:hypothetical protein